MTITSVIDTVAGEGASMEQDIGGAINNSKGDTVISEDIGQLLPTEVSSTESDNFDEDENDVDQENDNLLDEITEEDIRRSNNADNAEDSNAKRTQASRDNNNSNNNNNNNNNNKTESDLQLNEKKESSTSFRGRPSSCVFVASLAASLTDDELCISVTESFKQYGQLARVKVLRDPANRPYAFVQYTNDRDAKRALKMARGSMLNGRTLRCESARVNRTLFLTHVTPLYYLEVSELCSKFGELEQLVPSSNQSQFTRRFTYPLPNNNSWFIQFAYRDDAIRAFANLRTNSDWEVEWVQNIEVPKYFNLLNKKDNQQVELDEDSEFSDNNHDSFSSNTANNEDRINIDKKSIFVGQLDQSVTKEKLFERFSTHGKISDLNLIVKTNKVFAFIQFETEEAAAAALERENHAIFLNKTMHVQYKEIGGQRNKRNFRKYGFYGNGRNSVHGADVGDLHGTEIGPINAPVSVAGSGNHGRIFTGPQVNLAPPPINMYRRRTQENDPSTVVHPYVAQQIPTSASEFEMNYIPYMNTGFRRKSSFTNGWSSSRSHSMKSEMDMICGDGATDATSDAPSESGGQPTSITTYDNSSAGSMGQNTKNHKNEKNYNNNNNNNNSNNNGNNNGNTNANSSRHHGHHGHHNYNGTNFTTNNNGRRRYGKRGNNSGFHDTPKPYYFQPYYYHPMHYPMGPLGPLPPAHPSQAAAAAAAAAGNQPYMMIYPMPPPPPTGVDGNLLAQPLPLGPSGPMLHGSPATAQSQSAHSEVNDFVPNSKACQLDY